MVIVPLASLFLFYRLTVFGDLTLTHSLISFQFPDDPKLQSRAFPMVTWLFVLPTLMLRRNLTNLTRNFVLFTYKAKYPTICGTVGEGSLMYQTSWNTLVIPALGRQRKEYQKFKVILRHIETTQKLNSGNQLSSPALADLR